ncbi:MAG: family 10 glycosylhydrolase [Bacteroidetes bacterium]|nr:family 10 glycosylhydrolase [Bacteroidota bacterium]
MRIFYTFILVFSLLQVSAQTLTPKREFRAAWVATIGNIDWPSKQGLDAETQKAEFLTLLKTCKQNGLNALIVQIRPSADALYNSPYENWSRYLSGKQGQPPTPYYDPLTFMVDECHKQCVEFHAWFNPYRALVDATKNPNTADHITKTHPEWFVNYGGKKYFDPGLPEVRDYFTKVVLDVVKRYDIDAVHFDDYFYPYRIAKVEFPDAKSYAMYKGSFTNKEDWRRNNVDVLIESLSTKIKQLKPYVKFGISPFGVWRNHNKDADGSYTTAGQTNYDDLYANVLLWMKNKWIDYILPQLYWENGHRAADYATLLSWWSQHTYGRQLYIGHGLYQVGTSAKACWNSMGEIELQVEEARKNKLVSGSAYYSANAFKKNLCGLNYSMQYGINTHPALLPLMPWLDSIAPTAPQNLTLSPLQTGEKKLQWQSEETKESLQYAIYRFAANEDITKLKSENLRAIVRGTSYVDESKSDQVFRYVVTALDRLHNESAGSNVASLQR